MSERKLRRTRSSSSGVAGEVRTISLPIRTIISAAEAAWPEAAVPPKNKSPAPSEKKFSADTSCIREVSTHIFL